MASDIPEKALPAPASEKFRYRYREMVLSDKLEFPCQELYIGQLVRLVGGVLHRMLEARDGRKQAHMDVLVAIL